MQVIAVKPKNKEHRGKLKHAVTLMYLYVIPDIITEYPQFDKEIINLKYNGRFKQVVARARSSKNLIELSPLVLSHDLLLVNVLKHELAHWIEYKLHGKTTGHSQRFKSIARSINTPEDFVGYSTNVYNFISNNKEGAKMSTKKQETPKKLKNITFFTNEHGIDMVEITTKSYPIRVSLKKCASIINTENDGKLIKAVKFKGRELFEVVHADGKGKFKVGPRKVNAVMDNKKAIFSLMKAVYEEAQVG